MAKIDLDTMSIDDLVSLRENVNARLAEKIAARQAELEAEMERLSNFGKSAKKSSAAPAPARARKGEKKPVAESGGPPAVEPALNEAA